MTFTDREIEVLAAIRGGAVSMKAIAAALHPRISHRTAEEYVYAIAAKLPEDGRPPKLRVILYANDADTPTSGTP